ncbi:MAG: AMIN domain-containing protein [Terriglobales bacterium]
MTFLQRIRLPFAVLSLSAGIVVSGFAQANPPSNGPSASSSSAAETERPAVVLRVRVLLTKDYPALEIVTDRPVVPSIHKLDSPSRLTIDLPDTSMSLQHKEIPINTDQLGELHLDEEKGANQAVHMVVDLLKPLAYTWEAAGNRLTIRLQSTETETAVAPAPKPVTPPAQEGMTSAAPPSLPALTSGTQTGLVPVTPGGFGAVIFAGNRIEAGSTITAGTDTAVLSLGRNGEVHLCPRTTASVTTSSNGHDLMLGMSTGSLETHYNLGASIDSVLTPDFRILLAGPGIFEYAISADSRGNTCIGALPGNTRSAIVSELMGTGSYEVKPNEQVMFHSGRLSAADHNIVGSCGCPSPVPVMRASQPSGPVIPDSKVPSSVQLAQGSTPANPPQAVAGSGPESGIPAQAQPEAGSETSAPPPSKPNDVQAQVEAPLIFRASDLPPVKTTPAGKSRDSRNASNAEAPAQQAVLPPSRITIITTEKQHHGFFGKVKGFFKKIL